MVTSRTALRTFIKQHEPGTKTIQATDALTLYVEFANPEDKPTGEAIEQYICEHCGNGYLYTLQKVMMCIGTRISSKERLENIAKAGVGIEKPFPRTFGAALERLAKIGVTIKAQNCFNAATPQEIAKSYSLDPRLCVVGETNSGVAKYMVIKVSLYEFATARRYIPQNVFIEAMTNSYQASSHMRNGKNSKSAEDAVKQRAKLEAIELEQCRNMRGCTYIVDKSADSLYLIYRTGRVRTAESTVSPQVVQERDWLVAYAQYMEEWIIAKAQAGDEDADKLFMELREFQQSWPGEPEGWKQCITVQI